MRTKNMKNIFSLEELGIDTSNYLKDREPIEDWSYESYCQFCQNPKETSIYNEDLINSDIGQFTTFGITNGYKWLSLTTYFGSDIYKQKAEKLEQNRNHRQTMLCGGYALGQYLLEALNKSTIAHTYIREPIILNMSAIMPYPHSIYLIYLEKLLENFMETTHIESINKYKNSYTYDFQKLHQKDVIIPLIEATQYNLDIFCDIASQICGPNKATSVFGIFITRLKPALDGRETKIINEEDKIPIISPSPFFTPII